MSNHSTMRLGKRPRRIDPRTLRLARYLTAPLPAAPAKVDYTQGITDWGMMLNDQLGCCTIAAVGHAVQAWTANAGKECTVPDSTILSYYEEWDGYNPGNPASDQGGVELDVLNGWRQQGFSGHTLDAYVAIDLGADSRQLTANSLNRAMPGPISAANGKGPKAGTELSTVSCELSANLLSALWLFGGLYIGLSLPLTAQNQDVWDVPQNPGPEDEPGTWGGHAVYLVGYEEQGLGVRDSGLGAERQRPVVSDSGSSFSQSQGSLNPNPQPPTPNPGFLTCITWGRPKKMTFEWFLKYCDEAYALVSCDFIEANGMSPSGFDFAALESDLKLVTQ